MEFKLAREFIEDDSSSCAKITIQEIEQRLQEANGRGVIIYFDKDNQEKELKKIMSYFKNNTTFLRDLKYGLDNKDSIYEIHII